MTIRTRFAPSPTGSLHIGGARTALYCLLQARRQGGVFLLRIEDTDQARSTDEAAKGILRDLRWLGLSWDEGPGAEQAGTGPYFQSQRLDLYGPWFDTLIASGAAYEAWETTEELTQMRAEARAEKRNFHYRQRPYTDEQIAAFRAEGRTPILRLRAPDHAVRVDDEILGPVTVAVEDLDDIVIRKADGFPTYHFAVVMDDHMMGVSMVLRGQEHLLNTPKHLGLYEALGWEAPQHGHMPLIANPTGTKMSKRDKAKEARAAAREASKLRGQQGHDPQDYTWLSEAIGFDLEIVQQFMKKKNDGVALAEAIAAHLQVDLPMIEVMDFRKGGYLPEALLNYLALLGWSPGHDVELMTVDEMIGLFSLDKVNKTAARFDPAKLSWMNGEYIKGASVDRLQAALESYLEVVPGSNFHGVDTETRRLFLSLYQPRMSTLADLEEMSRFFFEAPTAWDPKAVKKHLLKGDGLQRLQAVGAALADTPSWTVEGLSEALQQFADAHELGMGKVAQPVRVAITGTGVSPQMAETLVLLGKDQTLQRIQACLEAHPEA